MHKASSCLYWTMKRLSGGLKCAATGRAGFTLAHAVITSGPMLLSTVGCRTQVTHGGTFDTTRSYIQEPLEYLESGVSLEAQCASWVAALLPLRDRVHTCVMLKFQRKTTGQATRKPAVKDSLKPARVQGSGASHYELRGNRASALRRRPASFADTGAGEPLL